MLLLAFSLQVLRYSSFCVPWADEALVLLVHVLLLAVTTKPRVWNFGRGVMKALFVLLGAAMGGVARLISQAIELAYCDLCM